MNTPENILELTDIKKSYYTPDENSVLIDFSLRVEKGELLTILGPTGCGKTTLLNIIAGIITPDAGTVVFADDLVRKRDIRSVFQHYTLFPWLTIVRNVAFGLEMRSLPRNECRERSEKILKTIGLAGYEHHYPHELSGGMRQRAAIAQAMVTEPEILLMDEPFGALDDLTRLELQNLLLELHCRTGVTTLFVTHNIDEAVKLGDRVLVLTGKPAGISGEFEMASSRKSGDAGEKLNTLFLEIRDLLHQKINGTVSE